MSRLIRSAVLTDDIEVARSFGLDPYRLPQGGAPGPVLSARSRRQDLGRARDLARRHVEVRGRCLSEVAYVLGFSATSAFSRWFRGRFGCSAMSWRAAAHPPVEPSSPAS
jgi:hypothetical protein